MTTAFQHVPYALTGRHRLHRPALPAQTLAVHRGHHLGEWIRCMTRGIYSLVYRIKARVHGIDARIHSSCLKVIRILIV